MITVSEVPILRKDVQCYWNCTLLDYWSVKSIYTYSYTAVVIRFQGKHKLGMLKNYTSMLDQTELNNLPKQFYQNVIFAELGSGLLK